MAEWNLESFPIFWHFFVDNILQNKFFLTTLSYIIAFFLLRLFHHPLGKTLVWLSTFFIKTQAWRVQIAKALTPPFRTLPFILLLAPAIFMISDDRLSKELLIKFLQSWLLVIIFWALYRLAEPLGKLLYNIPRILTNVMVEWVFKIVRIFIVLVAIASIFEVWGIQIAPLIAGLGLLSVGVGLGAQDLFKNLIAGMSIITEKRFNPGDWILVDGVVEGTVEKIGFRSTMVRRFDKAPVYVPNTKLSDGAVTNFSNMTHRRIYWMISLLYESSKEQLERVRSKIETYIKENDDFAGPPAVPLFVRIDKFNDSSIDLMLYCFTKTTNWGEWLKIKETLALKIKEIVEESGTGFAYPTSTLYLKNQGYEGMEAFHPPKTLEQKK